MTAPTEAEIRAVVDPDYLDNGTLNAAGRLSDAVAGSILFDLYDGDDLRESEDEALRTLVHDALRPIRDRAIADCREAVVQASLRFAAEHPDAPRAIRETVPA